MLELYNHDTGSNSLLLLLVSIELTIYALYQKLGICNEATYLKAKPLNFFRM
jgi:hypothetical protein